MESHEENRLKLALTYYFPLSLTYLLINAQHFGLRSFCFSEKVNPIIQGFCGVA